MTSEHIGPAVYNYLDDQDDLTALIGSNLSKYRIKKKDLKGSGESAVVINPSGGEPPRGNSMGNPRVNIYIYSDHTRTAGQVTEEDAEDRMWAIFHVIDAHLHWPNREVRELDGLPIIGSFRGVEPQFNEDKNLGMKYLWTAYDMNLVY